MDTHGQNLASAVNEACLCPALSPLKALEQANSLCVLTQQSPIPSQEALGG
jgi:hypothetical protein